MNYFEMKKRAFMSIVNSLKGFIRKVSGVPPITLPDCVDNDSLISYSIEGDSVGDKTVNLYDHTSSVWKNDAGGSNAVVCDKTEDGLRIIALSGGIALKVYDKLIPYDNSYTLTCSVHNEENGSKQCRILIQFFDADGNNISSSSHASKVVCNGVLGMHNVWYKGTYIDIGDIENSGGVIIKHSEGTEIASFKIGLIATGTANTAVNFNNIQLQKGAEATAYEPFGYKIPIQMSGGKNLTLAKEVYKGATNYSEVILDGRECVRFWDSVTTKYTDIDFKENTQYTVSFDAKTTIASSENTTGSFAFVFFYTDGSKNYVDIQRDKDWGKYTLTSVKGKTVESVGLTSHNFVNWIYIDINTFQLEEGTVATEYEPYIEPVTTNIYLDEPLTDGAVLEYPKDSIPKLPMAKCTTIYSIETEVQPSNMNVEYYSTRKDE